VQITNPKSPYRGWYDIVVPPGKFGFVDGYVVYPPLNPDIEEWLDAHVGSSGRATWVNGGLRGKGYHILIKDGKKATMFKLTFT
jgi:hypothetical protein